MIVVSPNLNLHHDSYSTVAKPHALVRGGFRWARRCWLRPRNRCFFQYARNDTAVPVALPKMYPKSTCTFWPGFGSSG